MRFNFIPIPEDDHRSACDDFDALDKVLSSGPLATANEFVEAGIDPAFDTKNLAIYAEIGTGLIRDREQWIEHWHYDHDRHANMDY